MTYNYFSHLAEHLTQINPRRMHRFNHVFLTLTHNIVISPQFIKTTQKPDYTKFVGSLSFDRLFKDSECLQDFQNSFVPIVENLLRITSAKKVVLIIPLVVSCFCLVSFNCYGYLYCLFISGEAQSHEGVYHHSYR